jgi:cellulose synthase/poly-beta-1,6-N-acetylglucosamine synthase-like glycosyltransferase
MQALLLLIFILAVMMILHTYLFYPLGLVMFTSKEKPKGDMYSLTENLPTVAILMAAYNEEKVIGAKIKSVFETNYPLDKITFYIGSDASTDGTDAIIKEWQQRYPQLKLVNFSGRTGKSGIINQLAASATEDIFILTDANVLFKNDSIFNLLRHFKNERTAQVCANIVKFSESNKGIAVQEKSYIALENKVKFAESVRWNIVIGAEGACYAIRRSSFSPVPPKFYMDDFYITMNVIEQGNEIVFDNEAVCLEDVSYQSSEEFKRKVRISIGNYQNLFRYKKLLFPPFTGIAFAFWSHKVFRWMTPFLLILCLCLSFILQFYYFDFALLFTLQLLGFMTPVIDWLLDVNFKPLRFISHFYMMNAALLKGFVVYVKGVESNVWQPTKREIN